jgi:hypothetical protein
VKLSRSNENVMQRVTTLSQNTNVTRLQRDEAKNTNTMHKLFKGKHECKELPQSTNSKCKRSKALKRKTIGKTFNPSKTWKPDEVIGVSSTQNRWVKVRNFMWVLPQWLFMGRGPTKNWIQVMFLIPKSRTASFNTWIQLPT